VTDDDLTIDVAPATDSLAVDLVQLIVESQAAGIRNVAVLAERWRTAASGSTGPAR